MDYFETFINSANILGCFILFHILINMIRKMDSMNKYKSQDTSDVYLLCDRIEDLEHDIVILKKLLGDVIEEDDKADNKEYDKEYDKEYVDMIKYKKDNLHMNDLISINKYDIIQINKNIKKLETKIDDLDSLTMK